MHTHAHVHVYTAYTEETSVCIYILYTRMYIHVHVYTQWHTSKIALLLHSTSAGYDHV